METSHSNIIELQEVLERAIKDGKLIKFDYVSEKMEITSRVVEPKEINDFKLVGIDQGKNGIRQFQFDGIQELQVIDKGVSNA